MSAQCPACSVPVSEKARFCPRCGQVLPRQAAGGPAQPLADGAARQRRKPAPPPKVKAPLPLAGYLFFASLVLGPACLVLGLLFGVGALTVLGVAILVGLCLLMVVGQLY